jgi:hypothetical protein
VKLKEIIYDSGFDFDLLLFFLIWGIIFVYLAGILGVFYEALIGVF